MVFGDIERISNEEALAQYLERPRQVQNFRNCRRSCRKRGRSQPVGATRSDMNHFSKGGVYGTRKTGQAFRGAEDRHVAPLEGGRVVA
jgi:hypothetical protein